jgi:hypothetical protein
VPILLPLMRAGGALRARAGRSLLHSSSWGRALHRLLADELGKLIQADLAVAVQVQEPSEIVQLGGAQPEPEPLECLGELSRRHHAVAVAVDRLEHGAWAVQRLSEHRAPTPDCLPQDPARRGVLAVAPLRSVHMVRARRHDTMAMTAVLLLLLPVVLLFQWALNARPLVTRTLPRCCGRLAQRSRRRASAAAGAELLGARGRALEARLALPLLPLPLPARYTPQAALGKLMNGSAPYPALCPAIAQLHRR